MKAYIKKIVIAVRSFIAEKHFTSLQNWQAYCLRLVMLIFCIASLPSLIVSVHATIQQGLKVNYFIYVTCYLTALYTLTSKKISYKTRSILSILIFYILSFTAFTTIGIAGSGKEFLLTAGILSSLLIGLRFGIIAILIQISFFIIANSTILHDFNTWAKIETITPQTWQITSLTYIFLSAALITAVGTLTKGLSWYISMLKETYCRLKKSEQKFKAIVSSVNDIIYTIDKDTKCIDYVSDSVHSALGYTPDNLSGLPLQKIIHPDDISSYQNFLNDILQSKQPMSGLRYRAMHADGEWRWHISNGGPLIDAHGEVIGYVGVARDVTDQIKAQEELLISKQEAETANRTKSEFLANMSHEIRTPLNGVTGMLQLLETSPLNTEQKQFVALSLTSCQRLTNLLSDILDISKVEAGKLTISSAPFDLPDMLESIEGLLQGNASEKGLTLTSHVSSALKTPIYGDEQRIRQILFNLAGNALKFTAAGSVTIDACTLQTDTRAKQHLLLIVSDTGIGIPADKYEVIFQQFGQVSQGYRRTHQGAGLGLPIVKRLVDLLGGSICVDSTPGEGTSVYVSIPAPPVPSRENIADPLQIAAPETSHLRILTVEDDAVSRFAINSVLARLSHDVETAENGREAVTKIRDNDFDLVLMDIQMPVMDGVEACKAVRNGKAGNKNRDIPIVAVTSYAMAGNREKFLASGMDGYISKPVDMKKMQKLLHTTLESRKSFSAET